MTDVYEPTEAVNDIMASVKWPRGRDFDWRKVSLEMLRAQQELISLYLPAMDSATASRALRTQRWIADQLKAPAT